MNQRNVHLRRPLATFERHKMPQFKSILRLRKKITGQFPSHWFKKPEELQFRMIKQNYSDISKLFPSFLQTNSQSVYAVLVQNKHVHIFCLDKSLFLVLGCLLVFFFPWEGVCFVTFSPELCMQSKPDYLQQWAIFFFSLMVSSGVESQPTGEKLLPVLDNLYCSSLMSLAGQKMLHLFISASG